MLLDVATIVTIVSETELAFKKHVAAAESKYFHVVGAVKTAAAPVVNAEAVSNATWSKAI